jgi:PhnB protein
MFGAAIQTFGTREDGSLLHAEARFEEAVIMFCDATPDFKAFPASSFVYLSDADGVMGRAAAMNLTILQELDNREYGRGGGFQDPFGNHWWVNTPLSFLENSV